VTLDVDVTPAHQPAKKASSGSPTCRETIGLEATTVFGEVHGLTENDCG
jgi:hypothetical protein